MATYCLPWKDRAGSIHQMVTEVPLGLEYPAAAISRYYIKGFARDSQTYWFEMRFNIFSVVLAKG